MAATMLNLTNKNVNNPSSLTYMKGKKIRLKHLLVVLVSVMFYNFTRKKNRIKQHWYTPLIELLYSSYTYLQLFQLTFTQSVHARHTFSIIKSEINIIEKNSVHRCNKNYFKNPANNITLIQYIVKYYQKDSNTVNNIYYFPNNSKMKILKVNSRQHQSLSSITNDQFILLSILVLFP